MMLQNLLAHLPTEQINARTEAIDQMSTLEIVSLMNELDFGTLAAVQHALPDIARAVDGIFDRMRSGGRLFYIGAGTSGRLGVLDASECPPTFSVPSDLVVGIIAGGDRSLRYSSESCEDDALAGRTDLVNHNLTAHDAVVAISASGYAPYCIGALDYANEIGALSIAMSCNTDALSSQHAQIAIEAPTGAETISGSTRLKAGTATKMMLNMLSTAAMIKLGKTYGNLMVDVRASNVKLCERATRLIMHAVKVDDAQARKLLDAAGGSVKVAIVMHECHLTREEAERALAENGGYVRKVIQS